jgi:site-specific DNA-cytosine methylase
VPQQRERITMIGFRKAVPDQTPQRSRDVAPTFIQQALARGTAGCRYRKL